MIAELATMLTTQGGVASSADLRRLGLDRGQVRDLVRSGALVRVRRETFVDGAAWSTLKPWERHALRARAVQRTLEGRPHLALSHHSALALADVSLHGVDDRVHVVTTGGGRSRPGDVVVLHTGVPAAFVREASDGGRCVVPAMASLQVAAAFGVEAGLVAAESARHQGLCSADDLDEAVRALGPVRGCRSARQVAELAGPLSESAGESRCRWIFRVLGLPAPVQQAKIHDRSGHLVARVDFLFEEERVVVEFDGMLKYGDIRDVRAEKAREDALRSLGYEVVRLTWADLRRAEVVGYRVHQAFARGRTRRGA